ncbi:hypothetical protein F4813DRAFT_390033 [Daldinia decipiens]|uniref:uncharacterized protein n=1 Tax=Daldinia decipiens TaxID=326647 RepID=UPI0020C1E284|nr:uncharacterized protein F4813DRAFT_390033 [Daldinia decipiens]KAI1657061.1 hypothetical protein F4813DRAFT_390033 [Daldinia decipiens]
MGSLPGPATLWGILKSEDFPISAPPAEDVDAELFEIPRLPSPMPNPAVELFGDDLENLVTPPYNGNLSQAMFYNSANAEDLMRLNYGLFHNDYPHVRDVIDPGLLRVQGVAAVETELFDVEVVVLIASGVPILVHVEMLRPLPYLYWMFVDPRDHMQYSVVRVLESANVWKIVLLAVYGTEGFNLDDHHYTGEEYIAAIALVQRWAGQDYVLHTVVNYFKAYCTRVALALHSAPVPTPSHPVNANLHDYVLAEIQRCYFHYQAIHGRYRTLPSGAFGAWALRAIYTPHLNTRVHHLSHDFCEEITSAIMIQASAHIFNYYPEDPIFLD